MLRLAEPVEYASKVLFNGVRLDGRQISSARGFSIERGILEKTGNSAAVKIGQTAVVAGLVLSTTISPSQGFLTVSVSHPAVNRRESSALSQKVLDAVRAGVDLKKLTISGKNVWHIEVALVVLEDQGGLLDACVSAAAGALAKIRLPSLDKDLKAVEGSTSVVFEQRVVDCPRVPLVITFKSINGRWLIDPCLDEETASQATISLGSVSDDVFVLERIGECSAEVISQEIIPAARHVLVERRMQLKSALLASNT